MSVPHRKRSYRLLCSLVHAKDVVHQVVPVVELDWEDDLVDVDGQDELVFVHVSVEALVVGHDFASTFLPNVFF
jgi:hypothetical protein